MSTVLVILCFFPWILVLALTDNFLRRGIRALWRRIMPPVGTDYLPGEFAKQLPEDVRCCMSADQAPR